MESSYRIRSFQPSDWDGWEAVWQHAYPQLRRSPEEVRGSLDRIRAGGHRCAVWAVEHTPSGRLVGNASLVAEPIDADPHALTLGGLVDPDHQRRGVGRALFAAVDAERRGWGNTTLRARVAAAPADGLAFLERRGFVEKRRTIESMIDPRAAEVGGPSDLAVEANRLGVEVFDRSPGGPADRLAESDLAELIEVTSLDVPRSGGPARFSREDLRAWVLDNPFVRPTSFWLARADGRLVAMSYASDVAGDPLARIQQFTGTRREYRGRGIGTLLKRHILDRARVDGIRYLTAVNDVLNAPIRATNARLGYRPVMEWVHLVRSEDAASSVSAPR